jgi:hypothetical protein
MLRSGGQVVKVVTGTGGDVVRLGGLGGTVVSAEEFMAQPTVQSPLAPIRAAHVAMGIGLVALVGAMVWAVTK